MKYYQSFILLLAITILFSGCSSYVKQQPEPLSEYFELKRVSGGFGVWKWMRDDIYVREKNGKLKYIGTTEATGWSPYSISSLGAGGLLNRKLAISNNGRSIVFHHWKAYAPSESNLKEGIYRYMYGDNVYPLHEAMDISVRHRARWPKPLPKNLLPFNYETTYTPKDMKWTVRADDYHEFPLGLLDASPINQCAFTGSISECSTLLKKGANINAQTYWGFTPLDLAIIRNHEETAIYIIEQGADLNIGIYPAFNRAVMLGRMQVVQAMIERGIEINKQDKHGYTSLHLAVYQGSRLSGGAGLFFDNTVTPWSIRDKEITTKLVNILLEHGASPKIKNKSGKTPLDEINKYTPPETIQLLIEYSSR